MRIGYLRFNLPVELDLKQASPRGAGCELRASLLADLVDLGHEIYILQYVPPQHRYWEFRRLDMTEKEKRLSELKYVPIASAKEFNVMHLDLDVLLIECGPTNTRFAFTENGITMPFVRRTFLALRDYEGTVVYWQHDFRLAFPFGECLRKLSVEYLRSLDEINLARMTWELGGAKLFFGGKQWIILHNALNERYFIEYNSTSRYKYRELCEIGLLKPRYIPQLLISRFDEEELGLRPKSTPQWHLMYVGNEKDKLRTRLLLEYFDVEGVRACLIGKWESKPWRHIAYFGVKGKQGDAIRFYNDAYATVYIPTEYMRRGGVFTSRIFQALLGGCIVFFHHDIYGIDEVVGRGLRSFILHSRKDLLNKLDLLTGLGVEDREFLVEMEKRVLLKYYVDLNWETILRW